jgi:PAS domain S-box-containing protein
MFAQESPIDLFYPDPQIRQAVIDSITESPASEFLEWRPKKKDGTEAICLWANFMNHDGQVFSMGHDITERKKAEALLLDSKNKLLEAQAMSHTGNWSWDVKKNVITWSDEVYRIYGISLDTHLTYETLMNAIHPEDRDYHDALTAGWLNGEPTDAYRYRVVHADGTVKYIHAAGECEFDETGEPIRMYGVLQDVTERRLAEAMLREREATLNVLLNAPLESILLVSHDGTVLSINEGGARHFGKKPEDLIGHNIFQEMDDETIQYRKKFGDSVFQTGQPVHFNDQRGNLHFANSVYPVFDSDGKQVDRAAIFATDITERILAEKVLKNIGAGSNRWLCS